MRPEILAPLFGRVAALPGVGPKTAPLFDRLLARVGAQARVVDLLFHLPTNVIDRSQRPTIAEAPLDAQVVVQGAGRGTPPPAGTLRQAALSRPGRGRHRRHRAHLLPRQPRLDRTQPACRRDPLDFRSHRTLRRPPSDGAPRPRARRGRARKAPALRGDLRPDRGTSGALRFTRDGRGFDPYPHPARMAGADCDGGEQAAVLC